MSAPDTAEVTEILNRVKDWPPESRIVLAQRILETLQPTTAAQPQNTGRSARELIGIGAGATPPPDDLTIQRWIDEHQMEKYG